MSGISIEIERSDAIELSIEGSGGIELEMSGAGGELPPWYSGAYEVVPATAEQTLETANTRMLNDVEIAAIPYYETANVSGTTAIIGG